MNLRQQLEEKIAQYAVHALRDEREPFMDQIMEIVEGEKRRAVEEYRRPGFIPKPTNDPSI